MLGSREGGKGVPGKGGKEVSGQETGGQIRGELRTWRECISAVCLGEVRMEKRVAGALGAVPRWMEEAVLEGALPGGWEGHGSSGSLMASPERSAWLPGSLTLTSS